MPDCTGLTAAACTERTQAAGFVETRVETLSIEAADLTRGAGELVHTSPVAGTRYSATSTVRVMINPTPLPVVVPEPAPGEDRDAYKDRLDDLRIGYTETLDWDASSDAGDVMDAEPTGRQNPDVRVAIKTKGKRACDRTPWVTDPYTLGVPLSDYGEWRLFEGDPNAAWRPVSAAFTVNHRAGNTLMRSGSARPSTDADDEWFGYGYRKIAAKHGWGPVDDAETRKVLAAPVQAYQEKNYRTRWTYKGQRFVGLGGRDCWRVVVADDNVPTGRSGPEGIITSCGKPHGT